MANLMVEGERVSLRPVTLADVGERYRGWLNDPDVNRYLETRFSVWTLDSIEGFVRSKRTADGEFLLAICLPAGGEHIGNLKIGPINPHHRYADLSLFIGEKQHWGRGLATEAIRLASGFAFGSLGLHKLEAGAYAANAASIRAFERCGYKREGLRRGHFMSDGRWTDMVLLGLLAENFDSGTEE